MRLKFIKVAKDYAEIINDFQMQMSQKLILTITITTMILEFSMRRVFEFTDFKSPVENADLCRESTKIGFYALKWT